MSCDGQRREISSAGPARYVHFHREGNSAATGRAAGSSRHISYHLSGAYLGVLMARGSVVRARRLGTLTAVQSAFEPLPIDSEVARTFAELVAEVRRHEKRPKIMDTWIAATAVVHDLPVYTQDEDFEVIPKVRVHRV